MTNVQSEPVGQDPRNGSFSIGKAVLIVILALVAGGLILMFGLWLGRQLAGPQEPNVDLPDPAPNTPYVVSNDYVNVRGGPSTDYPIYGVASPGDTAELVGKSPDGGWWTVAVSTALSADGQAWVSANYVTAYNAENVPVINPPPLPPDIEVPPPGAGKATCKTEEPMNVRTGPGNQYPSLGKVPKGITAEVIGVSPDGGWWVVVVPTSIAPEGQGWMSAAYCIGSNTGGVPVVQPPPVAVPLQP